MCPTRTNVVVSKPPKTDSIRFLMIFQKEPSFLSQRKMSPSAANSNNDSRLRQCSKSLNEALRKFFYRLGYRVALNPWKTVGCAFMLMFICMAGMTNFVSESRQEKLWIPQGTLALTHEDIIASTWTSESAGGPSTETRREYLIVAPASSDVRLVNICVYLN